MRHRKRRSKLSMMTAHRNAMLRNMVRNLFIHQRIETITARAKETRRLAEHLISVAKTDSVTSRRMAYSVLGDRDMVMKLFKEITPLFKSRDSGFTRIIPLRYRRGDGAALCILELTEKKIVEKLPRKKEKSKEAAAEGQAASGKAQAETKKEDHKKEPHAAEPKIKTTPKTKPSLDEEKRAEKAKSEDKKASQQRGFMKNIRGLFRKRGDR